MRLHPRLHPKLHPRLHPERLRIASSIASDFEKYCIRNCILRLHPRSDATRSNQKSWQIRERKFTRNFRTTFAALIRVIRGQAEVTVRTESIRTSASYLLKNYFVMTFH